LIRHQDEEVTTPFECHGVTHLSASLLTDWAQQPALAIAKIAGFRFPSGLTGARGLAVRKALQTCAAGSTLESAVEDSFSEVLEAFSRTGYMLTAEGRKDERSKIRSILMNAQSALAEYGTPNAMQKHFALTGMLPIPVVGTVDYVFGRRGINVVAGRQIPPEATSAHIRQAAVCARATKLRPQFLFVTDKKLAWMNLTEGELRRGLVEVTELGRSLERFLGLSRDIRELLSVLRPDYDHPRWNPASRRVGKRVFGY
jgi:hypothetical protein